MVCPAGGKALALPLGLLPLVLEVIAVYVMEVFRYFAGNFGLDYRILELITKDEWNNLVIICNPVVFACLFVFTSLV
jgi:hypothetical protein